MNRLAKLTMSIFATLLVVATACDDDDGMMGTVPTTGSVSGTVTFNGSWPATGDVQISVYTSLAPPWVPMGPPEASSEVITGSPATLDYKIEGLDKASYAAVFVGWRDPLNPMGARLIGMFWMHADSVGINAMTGLPHQQPTGFVVADGNLDNPDHDITADLDLIGP